LSVFYTLTCRTHTEHHNRNCINAYLTSTFKHDNWCRIIFTLELTNQSYSISFIQLEYIFNYAKSHHVWYTGYGTTNSANNTLQALQKWGLGSLLHKVGVVLRITESCSRPTQTNHLSSIVRNFCAGSPCIVDKVDSYLYIAIEERNRWCFRKKKCKK
jgi:hypothetical protein